MNWMFLLLWGFGGCALSVLFLGMQHWTVRRIKPQQVKKSKRLVIGGAVIRWILFSLMIILALQDSLAAMFVVFITFMVARLLLVFTISQKSLSLPEKTT